MCSSVLLITGGEMTIMVMGKDSEAHHSVKNTPTNSSKLGAII